MGEGRSKTVKILSFGVVPQGSNISLDTIVSQGSIDDHIIELTVPYQVQTNKDHDDSKTKIKETNPYFNDYFDLLSKEDEEFKKRSQRFGFGSTIGLGGLVKTLFRKTKDNLVPGLKTLGIAALSLVYGTGLIKDTVNNYQKALDRFTEPKNPKTTYYKIPTQKEQALKRINNAMKTARDGEEITYVKSVKSVNPESVNYAKSEQETINSKFKKQRIIVDVAGNPAYKTLSHIIFYNRDKITNPALLDHIKQNPARTYLKLGEKLGDDLGIDPRKLNPRKFKTLDITDFMNKINQSDYQIPGFDLNNKTIEQKIKDVDSNNFKDRIKNEENRIFIEVQKGDTYIKYCNELQKLGHLPKENPYIQALIMERYNLTDAYHLKPGQIIFFNQTIDRYKTQKDDKSHVENNIKSLNEDYNKSLNEDNNKSLNEKDNKSIDTNDISKPNIINLKERKTIKLSLETSNIRSLPQEDFGVNLQNDINALKNYEKSSANEDEKSFTDINNSFSDINKTDKSDLESLIALPFDLNNGSIKTTSDYGELRVINGKEKVHKGVDYVQYSNDGGPVKILAPHTGEVVSAGYHHLNGYMVTIRNSDLGLESVMCHLKEGSIDHLKVGEELKLGDYLGIMSESGRANGKHLHWTMRVFDENNFKKYFGNLIIHNKIKSEGKVTIDPIEILATVKKEIDPQYNVIQLSSKKELDSSSLNQNKKAKVLSLYSNNFDADESSEKDNSEKVGLDDLNLKNLKLDQDDQKIRSELKSNSKNDHLETKIDKVFSPEQKRLIQNFEYREGLVMESIIKAYQKKTEGVSTLKNLTNISLDIYTKIKAVYNILIQKLGFDKPIDIEAIEMNRIHKKLMDHYKQVGDADIKENILESENGFSLLADLNSVQERKVKVREMVTGVKTHLYSEKFGINENIEVSNSQVDEIYSALNDKYCFNIMSKIKGKILNSKITTKLAYNNSDTPDNLYGLMNTVVNDCCKKVNINCENKSQWVQNITDAVIDQYNLRDNLEINRMEKPIILNFKYGT